MSVPVICQACGTRLTLPPGYTKKQANCPKCGARIDLAVALSASAYLPTITNPPVNSPQATVREEDPLLYPELNSGLTARPKPPPIPLSLDDDPPTALPPPAAGPKPFRAPACVTADTFGQFLGQCEVVVVAHGLFLENEPFRPFLYVPVHSRVNTAGRRGLTVSLKDGRTVTLEFTGRHAARVADDTAAFLAGERGAPDTRDYCGATMRALAIGGIVLIAIAGIVCAVYLAGDNPAAHAPKPPEQAPSEPKLPETIPTEPVPPDRPRRPPSAVDKAYSDGVFRFEDGPDEVTALAVSPDGSTLVTGFKNGTTRVWNFDQPTFDPISPGPKCDGAPTRIQFDRVGSVVYIACNGGTVVAPWHNPPEIALKIPGDPLAVRVPWRVSPRFAEIHPRCDTYQPDCLEGEDCEGLRRHLPRTKHSRPMKARSPRAATADVLAWHPTGKLFGVNRWSRVLSWGATGPRFEVISREHKSPVRAWAAAPATWDFATGDDSGVVGLWANKSMTPKLFSVTKAAIANLAFGPSGAHLAVADAAGGVTVWDLFEERAVLKLTRPTPVKALAFGPSDDLILISAGKTVELWHIDELKK